MRAIHLASFITAATLVATSATTQTPAPTPKTGEEQVTQLMRGEAYNGPKVETPKGLDGKPDLTGFWRPLKEPGKPGGNMGKDEPDFILPFSEAGRKAVLYTQNHTIDPEALCTLGGIPRHNASGLPFEVLHTGGRIAFTYNYNTSRRIPVGENLKVPARPQPTYFGAAIAHWDADTLVIETTGLRDSAHDKIWLDENGNPTSDQTTVIERWTRTDYHHLQLEMTITDPKYYTRPIKFKRTWARAPKGFGQEEYACNELNLDAEHIGPGAGVIGPDGNRGYGYTAPLPDVPPGPEAYSQD